MVWGALFGRILGITVEAIQRSHPALSLFLSCHPDKPWLVSALYSIEESLNLILFVLLSVTPGMYALLGAVSALGKAIQTYTSHE